MCGDQPVRRSEPEQGRMRSGFCYSSIATLSVAQQSSVNKDNNVFKWFNPWKIFALVERVTDVVFGVMLLCLTIGIFAGTGRLILSVLTLFSAGTSNNYIDLISTVMTLFVVVELARSLADYFKDHHIRMTFIADAGLVFLIRDVMLGMFNHTLHADEMFGVSALLLSLGALRIGSAVVFRYVGERRD